MAWLSRSAVVLLCAIAACGDESRTGERDGPAAQDAGESSDGAPPDDRFDASSQAPDGSSADATVLGHKDSLEALGVDLDLPAYPDGLSAGYHPLRRAYTTL